jgi:phosphatidylserine decarboxylase
MTRLAEPKDALLVRQISGAIARRIVCKATAGEDFACGQRFGMIKFGSRTELYLPARDNVKCVAKVGDKVKAGETILVEYSM